MNKEELDRLLDAMVQSAEGISDLLFVAGRPMQMEIHGNLKPFVHEQHESVLTSARIEALAMAIIDNNPRLLQDLKEHGSCDCGYTLKNACRFRVNIYLQNGNFAMVLRHLEAADSDIRFAQSGTDIPGNHQGKKRHHFCDRRHGHGQDDHHGRHAERNQQDPGHPHPHAGRPD